jgi:hypothetical protein
MGTRTAKKIWIALKNFLRISLTPFLITESAKASAISSPEQAMRRLGGFGAALFARSLTIIGCGRTQNRPPFSSIPIREYTLPGIDVKRYAWFCLLSGGFFGDF